MNMPYASFAGLFDCCAILSPAVDDKMIEMTKSMVNQ